MKVTVHLIESESGWGQNLADIKTFRSVKAAKAYVDDFNKQNNKSQVPAWYMYAKMVEIDGVAVNG